MRKKFLATLMAVSMMVIGMVGCGEESDNKGSTASTATRPTEATQPIVTAVPQTQVTARPTMVPETTPSPTTALVVTPQPIATTAPTEEPEEEISGLIVMTMSLGVLSPSTCELISFNPITGTTKAISKFQFQDNSKYAYAFAVSNGYFSGSYHFDESYTKMAAERTTLSNFETHAGWLTSDGNFFDVTEAVGMASKSDFADAVQHQALGFTDNGLFVFCDNNNRSDTKCYSVPVSNVSSSTLTEGFIAPHSTYEMTYIDCISLYNIVSDWIDDTHYIMTIRNGNPTASVIYDTKNKTETKYISGKSRKNWNGRLSPDGTQIAFTSSLITGIEPPDIFIIPVNGGEPQRVANHKFIITDTNDDFDFYSLSPGRSCCMLIDWR